MPDMTTASLFGIHILCEAGCKVLFDDDECQVIYNSEVILTGYKDPTSNLWTLPILPSEPTQTTPDAQYQLPLGPCMNEPHKSLPTFCTIVPQLKTTSNSCTRVYATRPNCLSSLPFAKDYPVVLHISTEKGCQISTTKHGNLKRPHEASTQRNLFYHFETTLHPSPGFRP